MVPGEVASAHYNLSRYAFFIMLVSLQKREQSKKVGMRNGSLGFLLPFDASIGFSVEYST